MLRRKFVLILAALVTLLLLTSAGAVWQLQRVIVDLRHVTQESVQMVEGPNGPDPAHVEQEHLRLIARFRWLVLGIAVVFIVVLNLSVMGLLRMTSMVLRPMERLTEATRQLAQEKFEYRVEMNQQDEFDELARSYNELAAKLQSNELRKLETLHQVALALNHELNNAAGIITLQLELLGRQTQGNPAAAKYARQIHASLDRMTRSVDSLKRVRRIVLTDYVGGVKMLDLEKSADAEEVPAGNVPDGAASREDAGAPAGAHV
jgi:signal transduction histidine kinase